MITAQEARQHRLSIARNPSGWANIDFERISDELGVEVNHEMSPFVVRRVIEGRLSEMSVKDYHVVDKYVWDYLDSIQAIGKFQAVHVKTNRKGLFPLKLRKISKDTISLSPVGSSVAALYDSLTESMSWMSMKASISATALFEQDQVVIQSRDFYPWSERQLLDIFKSVDDSLDLALASDIDM